MQHGAPRALQPDRRNLSDWGSAVIFRVIIEFDICQKSPDVSVASSSHFITHAESETNVTGQNESCVIFRYTSNLANTYI